MAMDIQIGCFQCGTYCDAPMANQSNGSKCNHKTYTFIDELPPQELDKVETGEMFHLKKDLVEA